MPRYLFNVRGCDRVYRDEVGRSFECLERAEEHAAMLVRELASEGNYTGFKVCVVDDSGNTVARVEIGPGLPVPEKSRGKTAALQEFPGRELLTSRECEVLAHIIRGVSSKAAAKALGVSPRTVEFHRLNIMQKLAARNVVELIQRVIGYRQS